eukprot:scaffold57506_cov62-Phaeocystis_antarctica.AAC.2
MDGWGGCGCSKREPSDPNLRWGARQRGVKVFKYGYSFAVLSLDRAVARAVLASKALTKGKPLLGV